MSTAAAAAAAASGSQSSQGGGGAGGIFILFTGVEEEATQVEAIGALVAGSPNEATHVVCHETEPPRRTAKLMIAINSGCKYIVTQKWLNDSAESGRPIPLGMKSKYIVSQIKDFDIRELLATQRGDRQQGVFSGLAFYVLPGRYDSCRIYFCYDKSY